MTSAKIIAIGLTSLFISSTSWAVELDNQRMMCEFEGLEIILDAPMPANWSEEQKEEACMKICNSMKKADPIKIMVPKKPTPIEAVCDTDFNCENLLDKYKQYGVTKIFTAPDNRQRKGVNVLAINCKGDNLTRYTATEAELVSVCQPAINIVQAIEDEAKDTGEATEFSLNWYQLEVLIEANMADENNTANDSPTIAQFLSFMKEHPEAEVSGIYRNDKGTEKIGKVLNKPCNKGTECYKNNYGLQITDITIRFGDSDEMPKWFKDFCKDADNNTEYGRGFWHCDW